MNTYQLVYRNSEGKLRHEIVEGDTALVDSLTILDRHHVAYDAYEVRSNGNMVDIQEPHTFDNYGWF
jgi:hypothetical protein